MLYIVMIKKYKIYRLIFIRDDTLFGKSLKSIETYNYTLNLDREKINQIII